MKETNMEHFRGEIEKLKYYFGFINGEIKSCGGYCGDCEFHPANNREGGHKVCSPYKLQWLMSEYKPEPVLTEREKAFVEFAQEGWIARDECGDLYFYPSKPRKNSKRWGDIGTYINFKFFGESLFHFITWEDEEPWAVSDLRKLKVEGGEADE